jgi:DNA-binding transcriptional LysR family regulator
MGRACRTVYSSPSHTGLICAVESGVAVTALAKSTIPDSFRMLGPEEGFTELPSFDIGIIRTQREQSPAVDSFAAHVIRCFRDGLIPKLGAETTAPAAELVRP